MLISSAATSPSQLPAQAAVLGAALSYAFAGVYGRRFNALGIAPITTAAGQVSASAVVLIPLALYLEPVTAVTTLSLEGFGAITGLAVLSTAAAYVLYFKILEAAGATNLLLVTLLIPVSAVVLGTFVLGESLQDVHFLGMLLIATGLLVIDGRLMRRFRIG
jgi:drug/metabolite transporter (DMT)-like permease